MIEAPENDTTSGDEHQHADKYSDPRARITRRGVWLLVGVGLFALIATPLSVYLRRTRLERTTEFFGDQVILALQIGERIEMLPLAAKGADGKTVEQVELTRTPGLGHLRRALLDERHYDWATAINEDAADLCGGEQAYCVQLRITDPTEHRFPETVIDLELAGGWVGISGAGRRVRVTDRVRPALRHFLQTMINVKQQRYDLRE